MIRLVHEAGVCAFWFHPLVWLTGSRLALYRELSCDESVLRSGINTMQNAQKLSEELIVPNLDQDITFFYDPATKQLRNRFSRYVLALDSFDGFYDNYIQALTNLLAQIRAERQKQ